jgi:hypothetical protein
MAGNKRKKQMKEDIFTILKNGHLPLEDLIKYAETQGFNLKNFTYDDCDERYTYSYELPLLWGFDEYYIYCNINTPNQSEGEYHSNVTMFCDMMLDKEEERKFPPFVMVSREFEIKTTESIIDALNEWKSFVGEAYVNILCHRLEVLDSLDEITKNECEDSTKYNDSNRMKHEYKIMYDRMLTDFGKNVQKIIDFESTEEIVEEEAMDEHDIMMEKLMNAEAIMVDGVIILLDPDEDDDD